MSNKSFHNALRSIERLFSRGETIRINLSFSFPTRARCKKCGSPPSFYYRRRRKAPKQDVRVALEGRADKYGRAGHLLSAWFQDDGRIEIKSINKMEEFNFALDGKSFQVGASNKRFGVKVGNFYVDSLECDCGETCWFFQQTASQKRPEIANRQARSAYPNKFFW